MFSAIQIQAALVASLAALAMVSAAPQAAPAADASKVPAAVIEPIIDWGKCSQLAPSESQRKAKTEIIKECLEANPLKETTDAAAVEAHRIKLGECALNKEDWFDANKKYKYEKAEEELNKKNVDAELKAKILTQHVDCKKQALEKFSQPKVIIEQVQFYQACMDFHVSQLCNIKIMLPNA